MNIEDQWELWKAQNPVENIPEITEDQLRAALIEDLSKVSDMSVGEYTLYQKWLEVKNKYPTHEIQTPVRIRNTIGGYHSRKDY